GDSRNSSEGRSSYGRSDRGDSRNSSEGRSSYGRSDRGDSRNSSEGRSSYGRSNYGRSDRGDSRNSGEGRRRTSAHENNTNPEQHQLNQQQKENGYIRLNRYISNAGICSRREADDMILSGAIKVNGEVCTTMGTMVGPQDRIQFGNQTLSAEKKVYILMNKPKGYITTSDDPQERKTVMELLRGACKERVYPVGRLDRNTTGVLLFTNDGELTKKLTHPSHGARKIYHVTLDSPVSKTDLSSISEGIELEDGPIKVDEISFVENTNRKEVGLQIHSGKNRIVRRIFEHFGYSVSKLDRVLFAELSKKNLSRGQWRALTEKELNFLRMNTGEKTDGLSLTELNQASESDNEPETMDERPTSRPRANHRSEGRGSDSRSSYGSNRSDSRSDRPYNRSDRSEGRSSDSRSSY
ncbi:MAG: pseudouridine synthase, partial [Bacteroidales bacterium]